MFPNPPKEEASAGREGARGRRTVLWAALGGLAVLLAAAPVLFHGREPEDPPPSATGRAAGEESPADPASPKILAGEPFPGFVVQALRAGSLETVPLDLGRDVGARPVVFVYFLPNHAISEQLVREVQDFVDREVPGRVALYPVVRLGRRFALSDLSERLEHLGVKVPVIVDKDSAVQERLGAAVVPHLALIDQAGVLCFNQATSLNQPILGEVDVAEAIRMAARGEEPPTVRGALRYYPANELVGRPYGDLELPDRLTGKPVRLGDHVEPGKLAAVLYWSPRCPHSRWVMPGLVAAYKTYAPKFVKVISVVRDGTPEEIREQAAAHRMEFPILEDRDKKFTTLYRIISTPTLVIIGPDGTVDSVYTSGRLSYLPILQAKINSLILSRPPPG